MLTAARGRCFCALALTLCVLAGPGSAAAQSPRVAAVDGGEASHGAQSAAAAFDRLLPASVSVNDADRIEGQLVAPFLVSSGDHLNAISALGVPSIAKDPASGFTLDSDYGTLRVAPVWTNPGAPPAATVADAAVVYPSVGAGIDALVRPTAVGATTYLRIGDVLAGQRLGWTLRLAGGQRLRELEDGGVAVVARATDDGGADPATRRERHAAIRDAARVDDARGQYERAKDLTSAARRRLRGRIVAIVHPPEAVDAAGEPVTTSLEADGDMVTLTVEHRRAAAHPVVASFAVSYPSSWERRWGHIPGIGPAQRSQDGLIRALLPSGKIFITHGFDRAHADPARPGPEEDEADDFEQRGEFLDEDGNPVDPGTGGGRAPAPIAGGTTGNFGGGGPPHVCVGRNTRRLTLVYAGPRGAAGLTAGVRRRIRREFGTMNTTLYREAVESGGRAHPARFKVACDNQGRAEILAFDSDSGDPGAEVVDVLQDAIASGIDDRDSKYLIFHEQLVDEGFTCGLGDVLEDDDRSVRNAHNGLTVMNPSDTVEGGWALLFGRHCWEAELGLHENGHTMGAVQPAAPGGNGRFPEDDEPRFHCNDGWDVMCYEEDGQPYSSDVCTLGPNGIRYDCRYDSYFDTDTEDGEYLDRRWNIGGRNNRFLSFAKPPSQAETFVARTSDSDGQEFGIWSSTDRAGATPNLVVTLATCECGTLESPALSPNGRQVVYTSDAVNGYCLSAFVVPVGGGTRRMIFDCAEHEYSHAFNTEYAGANGKIVFDYQAEVNGTGIFTVKTDGTGLTEVVDWAGYQYEPTVTGAGLQLAFVSTHSPTGENYGENSPENESRLFMTDADGGHPVDMTSETGLASVFDPAFSHDGNWIAFSGIERGDTGLHFQVYAARIDGSTGLVRVSTAAQAYEPSWTPDGRLMFTESDETATNTALIRADLSDGSRGAMDTGLAPGSPLMFRAASYWVNDDYEPPAPVPIAP